MLLLLRLAIGATIVLLSLCGLVVTCWGIRLLSAALSRLSPSFQDKEPAAPARSPASTSVAGSDAVHDESFVSVHTVEYLPRATLIKIIEEVVRQTFLGKQVRILRYGLPRVVDEGSAWTQAGRHRHFESHKIR